MTTRLSSETLARLVNGVRTIVVEDLRAEAEALADAHGYTAENHRYDERNAIEHSHTSARLALGYGDATAIVLGALKELGADDPLDTARDRFNNEVGRRMARWIELNGYDESAIDTLVLDALRNGELVTDLDDPRINSQPPQQPTWRGPSEWHEPAQPLPDPNGSSFTDWLREVFDDIRDFFNDPWSYAPDWLRDLYDFLSDILADPLILDLDGDGIELTSLASSATTFDLDEDGVLERTGWVGPHDGLLVHDSNGNGVADGIGELFGSANVDGFDELKTLDANNDGRIDDADPAFAELLVWRDVIPTASRPRTRC